MPPEEPTSDQPAPENEPPPSEDPPEPDTGKGDDESELAKWKAMARKHEQQAKANADKAKRLDELEESEKSEVQRLTDASAKEKERAEKAEHELLRLRVASRKGLTEAQAKRLQGDSEDDLEADADDLMASFAPSEPETTKQSGRPQERLKPGASNQEEPDKSPTELADEIQRRRRGY